MPNTSRLGYVDAPLGSAYDDPTVGWTALSSGVASGVVASLSVVSTANFPSTLRFNVEVGLRDATTGHYANREIFKVSVADGTTLTVIGRSDNTRSHASGESLEQTITADDMLNNPGPLTTTGSLAYLAASGLMAELLAPADGVYGVTWSTGIPTWTAVSAGGAPADATYITQTPSSDLSAEQALSLLSTGILRVATTTGVITSLGDVLPVANGGTAASSASITAFNNITGYSASGATGTTSTNLVFSTSPTIVTPTIASFANATHTHLNAAGGGTLTAAAVTDLGSASIAFTNKSGNISQWTNDSGYLTSVTAHNLLSATHGDTLTASVVRGDVVIGNSTPKWSRLAIGAASRYLSSDGTDVSWAQVSLSAGVTGNLPVTNLNSGTSASGSTFWRGDGTWATPAGGGGTVYPVAPGLRLTTQTGVPVSASDRTAQGTIYYTPDVSSYVTLYSGSAWISFTQAELSLSLTVTSGKNYDVFIAYNSGTPNLVLSAAWTDDVTRADALATQNGMVVKSADHTLLWVGTIRASGTNITEDSNANRYVWNAYNQLPRGLYRQESSVTWTYSTDGYQQANANAANQVSIVCGGNAFLHLGLSAGFSTTSAVAAWQGSVAIGENSTTTPHALCHVACAYVYGVFTAEPSARLSVTAFLHIPAPLGKTDYVWLESGNGGGTIVWLGTRASSTIDFVSGMGGSILG